MAKGDIGGALGFGGGLPGGGMKQGLGANPAMQDNPMRNVSAGVPAGGAAGPSPDILQKLLGLFASRPGMAGGGGVPFQGPTGFQPPGMAYPGGSPTFDESGGGRFGIPPGTAGENNRGIWAGYPSSMLTGKGSQSPTSSSNRRRFPFDIQF